MEETKTTLTDTPAEEVTEPTAEKKKETKSHKVWKIIFNCVFFSIVGFIALYALINAIDRMTGYKVPFFGYRSSVIVSESMATANSANTYLTPKMKRIKKFDIVTTKNYRSYESIKMYDVITYSSGNALICHRVVDKYESDGKQFLVTRGDANNTDDTPISYSLVRGKVVSVTPKIGVMLLFMQSPYISIAIFGSAFFVCLGLFIYDHESDKKKKKLESQQVVDTQEIKEEEQNEKHE